MLISGIVFMIRAPYVGDLWAAIARESGTKVGVGLNYWFNWYAGAATPGSYSLLTPALSSVVGARLLLVIATVAVVPLAAIAARDLPRQRLAIWVCAAVGTLNLPLLGRTACPTPSARSSPSEPSSRYARSVP